MTPGRCSRAVRAALFAAVCVLLAAIGHVLMSGRAMPGGTLGAAFAGTAVAAWVLGGRERGLLAVTSAAVAFQSALHLLFSRSQTSVAAPTAAHTAMDHVGMAGMTMNRAGTGRLTMDHMALVHAAMGHSATGRSAAPAGHDMTDLTSSAGMLAAHLLAALLSGLWLAYGERAVFRLLRTVPARVFRPLLLLLAVLPVAVDRPRVRRARSGGGRVPRRLLLARALLTRGPPRAIAVF
ncbi:hypothetical protein [Streptomyces sp. NPDC018711]|uniref:hypothetical protein n=1 Tax=Streptomyces sp. NPDC018711 TaxID=3365052 RepID=UPI0037968F6D